MVKHKLLILYTLFCSALVAAPTQPQPRLTFKQQCVAAKTKLVEAIKKHPLAALWVAAGIVVVSEKVWRQCHVRARLNNLASKIKEGAVSVKDSVGETFSSPQVCSLCHSFEHPDETPNSVIKWTDEQTLLPCGHTFHRHCIRGWSAHQMGPTLSKNGMSQFAAQHSCPICGYDIRGFNF